MAICRLLSLMTLLYLFLSLHLQSTASFDIEEQEEDDSEYVLDASFASTRLRSRFLASIKKGSHCNPETYNICNGVSANHGKSLLHCCKKCCRNVLGDGNNCGKCGHKCKLNEQCCNGYCMDVANNLDHCGKCNRKCPLGERCEYGYCGYA